MKSVTHNYQKTECNPMSGETLSIWSKLAVEELPNIPVLDREFLIKVTQMAEVSLTGACHPCSLSKDVQEEDPVTPKVTLYDLTKLLLLRDGSRQEPDAIVRNETFEKLVGLGLLEKDPENTRNPDRGPWFRLSALGVRALTKAIEVINREVFEENG